MWRVSTSPNEIGEMFNCDAELIDGVSMAEACELINPALTSEVWRLDAADAWGHEMISTLGNGVETMRSNDLANGLIGAIQSMGANGAPVQSLNYTWTTIGNLDKRIDQLQGGLTEDFNYDNLNRLTEARVLANGNSVQTDLTVNYNSIGNITFKSNYGTYTYGARPHAVTRVSGVNNLNAATYTYDDNGNMLTGAANRSIAWTSYNLPRQLQQTGSNTIQYQYGPSRERISQQDGQLSITYVGALHEHHAANSGASPRLNKHYVQAGGRVVAIFTQAGTNSATGSYLHYDHRDSVDTVTSQQGTVIERLSYDAFGKRRTINWLNDTADLQLKVPHVTTRGFTSQEHLDSVGLIHYGGRVYDPGIGRFTSPDPFIQERLDLQSYNRYAYVRNNPLTLTDPSGYFWGIGSKIKREARRFESKYREDIKRYVAYQVASAAAAGGFLLGGPKGAAAAYYGTYKAVRAYQHGASPEHALLGGASRGLQAYGYLSMATGGVNAFNAGYAQGNSVSRGAFEVLQTAAHHAGNRYVRHEVGGFVQNQWGISLDQFNAGLLALSFTGDRILGDRKFDNFGPDRNEPGIRGYLNRLSHGYGAGLFFDTVDVALTYQGIPTATGFKAWWNGDLGGLQKGHSLGASEIATLQGLGAVQSSTVYALPFGRIAPGGSDVFLGSGDFVNGLGLGRLLNWDATMVRGPLGGHDCGVVYPGNGC